MARAEPKYSAKGRFTFQWTIMHLDMFGDVHEKELASRMFTVSSLYNTVWYLKLVLNEDMESATCFLHRTDSGPENIMISYSLSAGSSYSEELQQFGKNSASTMPVIIKFCELPQMDDQDHAKDVLIECHLCESDKLKRVFLTRPYPVFCSARTLIPCEQRNFFLALSYFGTYSGGHRIREIERVRVDPAGDNNMGFICEVNRVIHSSLGREFYLKFLKADPQDSKAFVLKYRIQLVDAFKKHHVLLSGRLVSNNFDEEIMFLLPNSMLEKKNFYLHGAKMLLFLEFAVSHNRSVTFIESTRYDCSDLQDKNPVCSWGVYLNHKYNEHRFLCRLLAVLVFIFSLIIPHLFTNSPL